MKLADSDIKTREVLKLRGVHVFHFWESSCSQKTRIFLRLKGIEWESHVVDLARQDNYKPYFLGINPRGLVPVLVHDGAVHIESNDILAYLDENFEGPKLIPDEHRDVILQRLRDEDDLHLDLRALSMRFVMPKFVSMKSNQSLQRYRAEGTGTVQGAPDPRKTIEIDFWERFAEQGITDDETRSSAFKFQKAYNELDAALEGAPYLLGSDVTALDIAWFIYTHRLTVAGYPFERLHPRVQYWYSRLARLPAFAAEIQPSTPLKVITGALRWVQRLRGTTLEKVAGL